MKMKVKNTNRTNKASEALAKMQHYFLTDQSEVLPAGKGLAGWITLKLVEDLRWRSRKPDGAYDIHYSFQKAMEQEMQQLRW